MNTMVNSPGSDLTKSTVHGNWYNGGGGQIGICGVAPMYGY